MFKEFNLTTPFPEIFPKEWSKEIPEKDFMVFRNLEHFKYIVSKLKQKEDDICGMSYEEALNKLISNTSDFPKKQQELIRDKVRSNLHKRGLITEEIYERYRYDVTGTKVDVDVGKFAAGEPDCVLVPSTQYTDFFYELYVSISYDYTVTNEFVRENTAKLLATIEELERQHIFIKVTLILPITQAALNPTRNFVSTIPLFSFKEFKSVETMSAVVNDRLLRKFYFAVLENLYKEDIHPYKGYPKQLPTAMCIGYKFDEVEFFNNVVASVGA